MANRKIIVEIVTGSNLYGTNRPDSDVDITGVFLPSTEDLLGMLECPKEWSMNEKKSKGTRNQKGDKDRKFYSLSRFIELAGQGQPGLIELLFAPKDKILRAEPEWLEILSHRDSFLSKKAIAPFIGMATAQAYKASIKGDTLNLIRLTIETVRGLGLEHSTKTIRDVFEKHYDGWKITWGRNSVLLKVVVSSQGAQMIEIGGRTYDVGLQMKKFTENLVLLESRYGSRSRAAADNTYDFKSLTHAYRVMFEGKEFLETGKITLPISGTDETVGDKLEWLKKNLRGETAHLDHTLLLDSLTEKVREAEKTSKLPAEADWKFLNQLCMSIQLGHLESGSTTVVGIDQDNIRVSGPGVDESWKEKP